MSRWDWLEKVRASWGFNLRVIVKAALLFAVLNVVFAALNPVEAIGRLSLYNLVVPGRERLPYGEDPAQSYNLSLNNIPAMFAAHELTNPRPDDEYRVLLLGDSGTWGWLLENDDTLAARLNAQGLRVDGRAVRVYNLGYPIMSLTKDLLLLDYAMRYDPDMIVWPVTLESFPPEQQLFPPLVQNNADRTRDLIAAYDLALHADDDRFVEYDFWEQTIVGQRRPLADWLRLQVYGFSWAATGIDQHIREYDPLTRDFGTDTSWRGYDSPAPLDDLAFDVLAAGIERAGEVPVLLVNEPIFISAGENSDLHYNIWYPRWAYDAYRERLQARAERAGWHLVDLWDALPADVFTDSPVHYTPQGAQTFAERLAPAILALAD